VLERRGKEHNVQRRYHPLDDGRDDRCHVGLAFRVVDTT
jgi:hypothetical protein